METTHEETESESLLACDKCDFTSVNQHDFNQHTQTFHMSTKVNICTEDQTIIACNLCDYRCKYNIQLRKHLKSMHLMEQKYNCKECEFSTDYVAHTWKHSLNQHPDGSTEINLEENENDIIF